MKVVVLLACLLFAGAAVTSAQQQSQDLLPQAAIRGESTILLSGRVVTEDNSPPPESVTVALDCMGTQRAEVSASPGGTFSFTLRRADWSETGSARLQDPQRNDTTALTACELIAKLPGYTSQPLHLSAQGVSIGVSDVGT